MKTIKFLIFVTVCLLAARPSGADDSIAPSKSPNSEHIEVPYLTHKEFLNLYEADQIRYMKLLQKAAVDLSYNTDYSATLKWPSWFNILLDSVQSVNAQGRGRGPLATELSGTSFNRIYGVQDENGNRSGGQGLGLSANNLMRSIRQLNERAERALREAPRDQRGWARRMADATPLVGSLTDTSYMSDGIYRNQIAQYTQYFQQRNAYMREIRNLAPELQGDFLRAIYQGRQSFGGLVNHVRDEFRAEAGYRSLSQYHQNYSTAYNEVVARYNRWNTERRAKWAAGRPAPGVAPDARRQSATVSPRSTVTGAPEVRGPDIVVTARRRTPGASTDAPAAPLDRSCVRCVNGGFVIVGQATCRHVNALSDNHHGLTDLQMPAGITLASMRCASASRPVLCNPVVFGFAAGGPLCVSRTSGATRACMAASDKSEAGLNTLRQFVSTNSTQYENLQNQLRSACDTQNNCVQNLSVARRADIRSTCAAVREQISQFRLSMRSYDPDTGGSPGATSTGGDSGGTNGGDTGTSSTGGGDSASGQD